MRVNGEPPQAWKQYPKYSRMSPICSRSSSEAEKKLRHLKATPNVLDADFAMESVSFLQERLLFNCNPRILTEVRGAISTFSKLIA